MDAILSRIFRLVRDRGERIILLDPTGGEPVVILPLSDYEGTANGFQGHREPVQIGVKAKPLTDDVLLDKINQEIVTMQEREKPAKEPELPAENAQHTSGVENQGEESFYIEPVNQ